MALSPMHEGNTICRKNSGSFYRRTRFNRRMQISSIKIFISYTSSLYSNFKSHIFCSLLIMTSTTSQILAIKFDNSLFHHYTSLELLFFFSTGIENMGSGKFKTPAVSPPIKSITVENRQQWIAWLTPWKAKSKIS